MSRVTEMYNKLKEKMGQLTVVTKIKELFNKLLNIKPINSTKEKVESTKNSTKDFMNSHDNIKCAPTGDLLYRFTKFFKNLFKRGNEKIDNLAKKTTGGNLLKKIVKVMCVISLIAFAGLVIYCIKDVFLQCLMLVATTCAITISIEFILKVISLGMGEKI